MHVKSILCCAILGVVAAPGHASSADPAHSPSTPPIIKIDPQIIAAASSQVVESDGHMRIVAGAGAQVTEKVVFHSADLRLQLDVSQYDELTLILTDWPVDELMYFLEGKVEISDRTGRSRIYGPGDSLVMPKGFNGTWKQLSSIRKVALSYDVSAANAQSALSGSGNTGQAHTSLRITDIAASDLRGTGGDMKPIEDWSPYLNVIGQVRGKYVEVPRFRSSDGKLEMHVKRFERCTLRLKNWPIDEFMHFLRGHLEIADGAGTVHSFGPGDTILIPKGFSGTWRQRDTIEMITAAYSSGAQ